MNSETYAEPERTTKPLRVKVDPSLYSWAAERSRLGLDELSDRFPKLHEWMAGHRSPTLKQVEGFARATGTAIGYFFLPEPPDEHLPIPDFRTVGDRPVDRPSGNLLDTIYQCQQRQDWYRDYVRSSGTEASLSGLNHCNRTLIPRMRRSGYGASCHSTWSRGVPTSRQHSQRYGNGPRS